MTELSSFIIGAGWIALLMIAVIAFGMWFEVWIKVKYRVWEQSDETEEPPSEAGKGKDG